MTRPAGYCGLCKVSARPRHWATKTHAARTAPRTDGRRSRLADLVRDGHRPTWMFRGEETAPDDWQPSPEWAPMYEEERSRATHTDPLADLLAALAESTGDD